MPFEGRRATAATYPCCGETDGTFGGAFSPRIETVGTFVGASSLWYETAVTFVGTFSPRIETGGTFVGASSHRGATGGTIVGAFSARNETAGTIVAGWVMPSECRSATADTYPCCGETGGTFGGAFSPRIETVGTFVDTFSLWMKPLAPLLIINGCFGGILRRQRCWGFHPAASVTRRWWQWFHLLVDESGERHR